MIVVSSANRIEKNGYEALENKYFMHLYLGSIINNNYSLKRFKLTHTFTALKLQRIVMNVRTTSSSLKFA